MRHAKIPTEKTDKKSDVNLDQYAGVYTGQPWGSEKIVAPWYGNLVVLNLPTDNPDEGMILLQHVSGDIFKRMRTNKTLAEEIRFERDSSGKVTRMLQHSNYSTKIISDKK